MTCNACRAELEADALYCGHCGRRTRVRRDSALGTLIDETYRIEQKLASGGFGAIYRATHMPSGLPLALKVLHADFIGDPALAGRFLRESKALAQLRNPHTVVTYERGEARDGTLYIAMELLRGESLQERFLAHGPLPWRQVLAIVRAVCSALAEAHALGIVHRDLKPANIHLGANDFVKVLDFGVAKLLPWSAIDDGSELTLAGQAVGTLEYMAPEQLCGGACDPRTDVYALGVVAYEMITGRRPFAEATHPASLITALLTQVPPVPSTIKPVPGHVDQLLLRCLEREQADRFIDVRELVAMIDRILGARPPPHSDETRSCAGLQTIEARRHALAPTIAFALPAPEPRRRPSQMPAFEFPVRGSVVEVRPASEPVAPAVTAVAPRVVDPRPGWIWLAGLVAGLAAIAGASLL